MPADSAYQLGQTVGARVRAARLKKKMTQNQLARPDFSVSYVSAIERGQIQPSLRALEILAQRLDISSTDLLPARAAVETGPTFGDSLEAGGVRGELQFLEAQIALYQRQPERAIEVLYPYLPQKGERQQEKDSGLHYVLGWAFLDARRLVEGESLLAEAARRAREMHDPWYPCILSMQIAVYSAMFNTEQAAQVKRESLRLLTQEFSLEEGTDNLMYQARLRASLGQYYSLAGDYEQAIEQFQQTLQLLDGKAGASLQANYSELFQRYLEQERYSLAMLNGAKWYFADLRQHLSQMRSELVYQLGRALLKTEGADAYDYLETAARAAQVRGDYLTLASANAQLATWHLSLDQVPQAEQLMRQAREQVESYAPTPIQAYIQILSGEVAYRQEDFATGDGYFESGLALFEQLGAHEELMEYLARYAQLLEERDCIQKALLFWKRAYEYRQKSSFKAPGDR